MTESGAKPAGEPGGSAAATDTCEFAEWAAIVTGGASGIGLARRGPRVAVLDWDPVEAEPGLDSVLGDVTDEEPVDSAADALTLVPED